MSRDAPPSEVETAVVYLFRHGETEWSASGRHTGRTDLSLTVAGDAEARALRSAIAGIRFDNVFTSPALRARRTCELAGLAADAEIDPDLAEWDYGEFEGKRSRTIRETRPEWMVYRDGCPGGESASDSSNRADRVIAKLRSLSGTIALFSHGQFGCSLAVRWIGLQIAEAQHLWFATASFGILGTDPNHPGVSVIAQWNVGAPHRRSLRAGAQPDLEISDAGQGRRCLAGRSRG